MARQTRRRRARDLRAMLRAQRQVLVTAIAAHGLGAPAIGMTRRAVGGAVTAGEHEPRVVIGGARRAAHRAAVVDRRLPARGAMALAAVARERRVAGGAVVHGV